MQTREFHPVANIFPLMEGVSFTELVEDIRQLGLREPVVLHPDGRIVDGRNRYRACVEAGIEPAYRTWDESIQGDLVAFVLSLNLRRRHLDEAQRAIVAGKIANLKHGANQYVREVDSGIPLSTVTQPEAAAMLNVSVDSVKVAKKVIEKGTTALVQAVERGDMSLREAEEIAVAEPERQNEIVAKPKAERRQVVQQMREQRAEGRVDKSRAAVQQRRDQIRELASQGHAVNQIAEAIGIKEESCRAIIAEESIDVPASRVMGKIHRHDSTRIVEHIVMDAENLTADVHLIEFGKLDRERLGEWIDSLTKSKKALNGFIQRLLKEHQRHGQAA